MQNLQMHVLIKLKFGTPKGLIKANLSTKSGGNPIKNHRDMNDRPRKIRSNFCHAHRVNLLKE